MIEHEQHAALERHALAVHQADLAVLIGRRHFGLDTMKTGRQFDDRHGALGQGGASKKAGEQPAVNVLKH